MSSSAKIKSMSDALYNKGMRSPLHLRSYHMAIKESVPSCPLYHHQRDIAEQAQTFSSVLFPSDTIMIKVISVIVIIHGRFHSASSSEHCRIDRAVTSDLFFLMLYVFHGSLGVCDGLVAEDEKFWILPIHTVDVFE